MFHKLKWRSWNEVQNVTILGYRVYFRSYGELINQFEEIFIDEIYRIENNKVTHIIDCGSNIGLSILYFSKVYPLAHVMAFEPNPYSFELLEANVKINKINNIELYNVALGSEDGKALLTTNSNSPTSLNFTILNQSNVVQSKEVEINRLSNYISFTVSLLKIDVEGSEYQILKELIESKIINLFENCIIEFHSGRAGINAEDFVDFLRKSGFSVRLVSEVETSLSSDLLLYASNVGAKG